MNRLKYISRDSWYQLKRLQSSSSVPAVEIPARIERGPTDILNALKQTISYDQSLADYIFHDDPFLYPRYRNARIRCALSYESGKQAALWIHKEHGNLFPQHLSEPPIKAFQPPVTYTSKEQVSETVLSQAISELRLSDAVNIYDLLEGKVSTPTKQALFELLCFHNNEKVTSDNTIYGQWFLFMADTRKYYWKPNKHIDELYEFLTQQDFKTATLAHNTMLCGLIKYSQENKALEFTQKLNKENIPLTLASYNSIIHMIPKVCTNKVEEREFLYRMLKSMNKNGVKPDIRTMNAAFKVVSKFPPSMAENVLKHLCREFKKFNLQFSLATYYYIMFIISKRGDSAYNDFMGILDIIPKRSFTVEDPADTSFFVQSMQNVATIYGNRKAADKIHEILLIGDNYKFLPNQYMENKYYELYLTVILMSDTIDEFFTYYDRFVWRTISPTPKLLHTIINELTVHKPEVISKYVVILWSHITRMEKEISLKISCVQLMTRCGLPDDSSLRSAFISAVKTFWTDLKSCIEEKPYLYEPMKNSVICDLASMLLRDNCLTESVDILMYTIERPQFFIPTITAEQLNELFENFISKECIVGAFLVFNYSLNYGFKQADEMASKLHNHPQLTDTQRQRLIASMKKTDQRPTAPKASELNRDSV